MPDQPIPTNVIRKPPSDLTLLGIILLVALVNGLLYAWLMPPWQHYDEPKHFEYVWQAAHLDRLPQAGDYDAQMSHAVLTSMVKNRFYGDSTDGMPAEDTQVQIPGYTQLDEPPGYYLVASLPVRLLRIIGKEDVTAQLRVARLASLILYLITIACAWGVACELTRPGHALRWMTPLSLALLPGFADVMTAVNNDVGAVAVFSLFLWGSVRLIQRPFSLLNLAWVLATIALGYFVKITTLYSLVLLPLVLLLAFLRGRLRWLALAVVFVCLVVLLFLAFDWGDPTWWGRDAKQEGNLRVATEQAPLGEYAFWLELPTNDRSTNDYQLHQLVELPEGQSLQGQEVTLGAWMWADRPVQAYTPTFGTYNGWQIARRMVDIDQTPRFIALTAPVEGDAQRNIMSLAPLTKSLDGPAQVYYDGVILLPGRWPLDTVPEFADASGDSGVWGGRQFQNLIRNPSAEAGWLRLKPWIDDLGTRILPDKGSNLPSLMLYYLLDTPGSWPYQRFSALVLFRTFWARFGWGHVPLIHGWTYWVILVAMSVGLIGAGFAAWRLRKNIPWSTALFLLAGLFGAWLQTYLRGSNYTIQPGPIYFPTARYAFTVNIAALLLLNFGWYESGRALNRWLGIQAVFLKAGYILAWVIFDLYALASIANFYR